VLKHCVYFIWHCPIEIKLRVFQNTRHEAVYKSKTKNVSRNVDETV